MKRLIRRPSPAMVVAFIALVAGLAPTATALKGTNLVSSNDIITGAVKKSDAGRDSIGKSELREDDDGGGGLTGDQVNEGTLQRVGSAESVAHAALVASNGAFVRGRGVRTAQKVGVGRYTVTFDRDVRACVYLVAIAGPRGGNASAIADANANAVDVYTRAGGNLADRGFHLGVSC